MQIELTRFRIKKGKEAKAQEWMDFLNSQQCFLKRLLQST